MNMPLLPHPTIVDDFLQRTLRPLRSPTLEDTQTWLSELALLQAELFNKDTTELFLRADERRSLIELNLAIALFERLGSKPQLGRAFLLTGNCYHGMGSFSEAQVSYQNASNLFEECKEADGTARALGNLGNVHNFLGEYPQAL